MLKDYEIVVEYEGKTVHDEIDPKFICGTTAIGFEYWSKKTGNVVILHPAQCKYITYKLPQKNKIKNSL